MENTINQRLKILVELLGERPGTIARTLGLSDSTFRNYIDRDSKPGYDVLEKLHHSFKQVNLYWLFGDPGEPLLTGASEPPAIYQTQKKNSRSLVVGHVAGNATQNQGASANEAALQRELELLRSQLADKERTIQILLNQLPPR